MFMEAFERETPEQISAYGLQKFKDAMGEEEIRVFLRKTNIQR